MSNVVIQIEGLGKQYRLGQVGTTTLADDLKRMWYRALGKDDPFLKIGEENDRTSKSSSDYVWALQDINFTVNQGDVLGIVGKNGAGKSTLLKILSRTTAPSVGEYRIKGRVASLLEVGTGFHPDLTGKENVYLNGAILGMTKSEIRKHFDEIVAFSGVERYIDTPVKRYSSGMYVRLAFAVAAHLEPEILIVDEVLAVGDAEFQKKCLGKMKDVSGQGRTVLFVSHNMAAVKSLCTKGILLSNGKLIFNGTQLETVNKYQFMHTTAGGISHIGPIEEAPGNSSIRILQLNAWPRKNETLTVNSGLDIEVEFYSALVGKNIDVTIEVETFDNVVVFHNGCVVTDNNDSQEGIYKIKFGLPDKCLNTGKYLLSITFGENQRHVLFHKREIMSFEIHPDTSGTNFSILPGLIIPEFDIVKTFKKLSR